MSLRRLDLQALGLADTWAVIALLAAIANKPVLAAGFVALSLFYLFLTFFLPWAERLARG